MVELAGEVDFDRNHLVLWFSRWRGNPLVFHRCGAGQCFGDADGAIGRNFRRFGIGRRFCIGIERADGLCPNGLRVIRLAAMARAEHGVLDRLCRKRESGHLSSNDVVLLAGEWVSVLTVGNEPEHEKVVLLELFDSRQLRSAQWL